jgi:uncharacterized LabA/DUF88 family protein
LAQQDRVNIAVFIDFDNIEIGVKNTLGEHFDVGTILEALKERGEVVTKIAYADWTRAGEYSRHLTQHAIRLVQRNLTPGGDKNGADINLALDALEMAFTHPHINAYVIVGGDSDFLSLVEKLKQYDKKVFVVGGRAFTSIILQKNCHEFIAYENLIRGRRSSTAKGERQQPAAVTATAPLLQAVPLLRRALKILADREVTPQTGLLKSTLLQLDSTFSERNYGASSFLDFAEKLAKEGVVTLKTAGRSVTVELNEAFAGDGDMTTAPPPPPSLAATTEGGEAPPRPVSATPHTPHHPHAAAHAHGTHPAHPPALEPLGTQADGVARASKLLAGAKNARWPMYLRNVKQILRQADGGFDERRYNFGGLMDLLKALQREQFVRIERDRRGGLRVFQASNLPKVAQMPTLEGLPQVDESYEAIEELVGNVADEPAPSPERSLPQPDVESDGEPVPQLVDTTAELLGRATPKPRRPRATRAVAPKAAKARKTAGKRSTRGKKASDDAGDESEA